MQILLDTHSFLWFIAGDTRCSINAKTLITNPSNQALLSVTSLWEISIKISLGKLTLAYPFDQLITQQLTLNTIEVLPIGLSELGLVAKLPFHHRDPFDRLLVAQALTYNLPLISVDQKLEQYGITRLW